MHVHNVQFELDKMPYITKQLCCRSTDWFMMRKLVYCKCC